MHHKDTVLIMTVYHPKAGLEDEFVMLWQERICALSYNRGANFMGIYHNEESDQYVACGQWPNRAKAEEFLNSEEFKKVASTLDYLCLIPANKAVYDILREAA